jgi:aspartate beta-hydroxylase
VSAVVGHVEKNFEHIKQEYLSAVMGISPSASSTAQPSDPMPGDYDLNGNGGDHAASLHDGNWDWHSYIQKGGKLASFRERCPKTARCIDGLGTDLFDTPFAFCFFSTLHGGAAIKPHAGPMNLRLRVHLPLIVPKSAAGDVSKCGISVGGQHRVWEEGKAVVLDDSYVHSVWNNTEEPRVVLLFDIWHPDVTREERTSVNEMFSYAKHMDWLK